MRSVTIRCTSTVPPSQGCGFASTASGPGRSHWRLSHPPLIRRSARGRCRPPRMACRSVTGAPRPAAARAGRRAIAAPRGPAAGRWRRRHARSQAARRERLPPPAQLGRATGPGWAPPPRPAGAPPRQAGPLVTMPLARGESRPLPPDHRTRHALGSAGRASAWYLIAVSLQCAPDGLRPGVWGWEPPWSGDGWQPGTMRGQPGPLSWGSVGRVDRSAACRAALPRPP